jgi:alkanesulfonate monooxygenase SsuD/methylene tetrahydromethanopterin reductase-like flavin-dependent oxidoreductase (luciferase family)
MSVPGLGVVTPLGYGNPPSALRDFAVAAERRGVAGIQVGELASTEVFSLVSAMAAATSRIRLDTAVVATPTRSPALLAMGAATLAELSSGRFVLGLGVGSPAVAGWHGREFPARPRTALAAVIGDVRAALAGERLPGWGGFRLTGLPPRPDVRIFAAAMNEQMLRTAGQIADGVVVNFCPADQAARLVPLVRSARAEAGVTAAFEFVANVWAQAGSDAESAQQRLRWEIAPYMAVPTYRAAAVAIAGRDAIERADAAWHAGGREAAAPAVPQELIDSLLIYGGTADFAGRLAAFRAAGVDTVRLVPLTSLGGGIDAAYAVADIVGELSSGRPPASEDDGLRSGVPAGVRTDGPGRC